ncbi:MAG: flagellar export chaperone FlgN [Actinomycetota bacterium]
MTAPTSVDLNRLNGLLWRYRPLLERFEFLLEVQMMVTASGRQDWQRQMADLFEETADQLNTLDMEREVMLGDSLTLADLAGDAPEPWDDILAEQQADLAATAARITGLRERNTQAMTEGSAGIGQLIDALVEASGQFQEQSGPSYGQDGRLEQRSTSAVLFDGRA